MKWFVVTFEVKGFERPMETTILAVDEVDAAALVQDRHPNAKVTFVKLAKNMNVA